MKRLKINVQTGQRPTKDWLAKLLQFPKVDCEEGRKSLRKTQKIFRFHCAALTHTHTFCFLPFCFTMWLDSDSTSVSVALPRWLFFRFVCSGIKLLFFTERSFSSRGEDCKIIQRFILYLSWFRTKLFNELSSLFSPFSSIDGATRDCP